MDEYLFIHFVFVNWAEEQTEVINYAPALAPTHLLN